MTIAVVIFSVMLGGAAILMPAKRKLMVDVESNQKGKVKYVTQKKAMKQEKKTHFLQDNEKGNY